MADQKKANEPDVTMTEEQRGRVREWLEKHWKNKDAACPICGNDTWRVLDKFAAAPVMGPDGTQYIGQMFPCFIVMCSTCAHTLFFNAMVSGVFSPIQSQEAANAQ